MRTSSWLGVRWQTRTRGHPCFGTRLLGLRHQGPDHETWGDHVVNLSLLVEWSFMDVTRSGSNPMHMCFVFSDYNTQLWDVNLLYNTDEVNIANLFILNAADTARTPPEMRMEAVVADGPDPLIFLAQLTTPAKAGALLGPTDAVFPPGKCVHAFTFEPGQPPYRTLAGLMCLGRKGFIMATGKLPIGSMFALQDREDDQIWNLWLDPDVVDIAEGQLATNLDIASINYDHLADRLIGLASFVKARYERTSTGHLWSLLTLYSRSIRFTTSSLTRESLLRWSTRREMALYTSDDFFQRTVSRRQPTETVCLRTLESRTSGGEG
ncbi:uncharacterized protein BCR38DRAFT_445693 [Pseudomassariella vexata]|uniref:Uncharacterized protein n=1 Tax=Pseudomassariella vexata TaxID=1141098 RepID=A0A1Y2DIT0_9PEZI|nr:uncharacterized protein BCR38DRAFT_445693 [Pseudomassariella vexata]ORY59131.1 hypothetical protein BCR38DRAFT_445693 [Pseudomassariella vexata]